MRTLTILALAVFAFHAIDTDAQCARSAAACPTTFDAALTAEDCAAYDGSRSDLYTFDATAGTTITISVASTSFDTFLGLIDPAGVPVAMNDDAVPGSSDSRIVHTLTTGGTWTVVVNNLHPAREGSYNLSISGCATGTKRRSVRR